MYDVSSTMLNVNQTEVAAVVVLIAHNATVLINSIHHVAPMVPSTHASLSPIRPELVRPFLQGSQLCATCLVECFNGQKACTGLPLLLNS